MSVDTPESRADTLPVHEDTAPSGYLARLVHRAANAADEASARLADHAHAMGDVERSALVLPNSLAADRARAAEPLRLLAGHLVHAFDEAKRRGLEEELRSCLDAIRLDERDLASRRGSVAAIEIEAERVAAAVGEHRLAKRGDAYQEAARALRGFAEELRR